MTKNRYKLANPNNLFKDMNIGIIKDNTYMLKLTDVVELLNNLSNENEQLKQQVEDLYESDKSLRKFASNMTLNYTGICVPRRLFIDVITILKDIEHNDLVEDLSKESIDTSANGG